MRFVLWTVLFALFFAPMITMATPEASPEVSARKPYLSHAGRFVAAIPTGWMPDRSLTFQYAGGGGYVSSWTLDMPWGLMDRYLTLDQACTAGVDVYGGKQSSTTVAGTPACLIEPVAVGDDQPVFVVMTHPKPRGLQEFVLLTTNRGALDRILETVSFDLSGVSPQLYLDAALDVVSIRSLQRDLIDWEAVRAEAHATIANVSPEHGFQLAHQVLLDATAEIREVGGDGHNQFMSAAQVGNLGSAVTSRSQETLPIVLPDDPAPGMVKIVVPRFSGSDEAGRRYVESLWTQLEAAVDDSTCGIVVDLISNGGGNMYPMLQGLGPLIGEGPVLGFTDAAGNSSQVSMHADHQLMQTAVDSQFPSIVNGVANTYYTPEQPAPDLSGRDLAVAVLIGSPTASSGEATAIGLREVDFPVRFFGTSTSGFATSGFGLPLIDGALVLLSDHWTTTVEGETFPDGVPPDVEVDGWNMSEAVEEWIRETADC